MAEKPLIRDQPSVITDYFSSTMNRELAVFVTTHLNFKRGASFGFAGDFRVFATIISRASVFRGNSGAGAFSRIIVISSTIPVRDGSTICAVRF